MANDFTMKQIFKYALMALMAVSCGTKNKSEGVIIPIIIYNPATFQSDIENALTNPASFKFLTADSHQLSGMDKDILEYLGEEDAFIVSLKDDDTELAPEFIGIKDKEEGYLKYLNVIKEQYRYSLDAVIKELYGSVDDYIASRPEEQ